MTFDGRHLLELLPAVYRLRDAELAGHVTDLLTAAEMTELAALEGSATPLEPPEQRRLAELRDKRERGPLAALLVVLAEQLEIIEEDLQQLYDDQFVETAASWALPYIGDLIGYRVLHGKAPRAGRRAELAHTIAFRRRKGTASMLEQLARDVTGWDARVVEFFALLATNQSMNHRRPGNLVAPSMRDGDRLEWVGSAFDTLPRTFEARRIATGGGRYNIPNIGIFLWRIDARSVRRSPATADPTDASGRRFRFSPLGDDVPLYTRPEREDEIAHLAEPINVPAVISRRRLWRDLDSDRPRLYGPQRSLAIHFDATDLPPSSIVACDLSDVGGGWAHDAPAGKVAVDPVLGRLVVAGDVTLPADLRVTYHRGAASEIGGGEYPRSASFDPPDGPLVRVPLPATPSIQSGIDALVALGGRGVLEIVDSGRYQETLTIAIPAGGAIELRAADGRRPTIELGASMKIRGGAGSSLTLNGLQIAGDRLHVPAANNQLRSLRVLHCTLVPGRSLAPDGTPSNPAAPSLTVAADDVAVAVERCISGPIRAVIGSQVTISDSIVDAGSPDRAAYARPGGGTTPAPGGGVSIESSTVIGTVRTDELCASNSILFGRVEVIRRQEGCLRFSYAPLDSIAPRRHRCQPTDGLGAINVPHFASLRFGAAAYARLADGTPRSITAGAEDESEMGAFRRRFEPQRHADLLTRLDEYLRVGLQAGIFHAS